MKSLNLEDKKFGRLTVIRDSGERTTGGKIKWECICECGNKCKVSTDHLNSGNTKSCGCLQKEKVTKHGCAQDNKIIPEYTSWCCMKARCLNSQKRGYKNYGGRGISVCNRWFNSFENFFKDMGKKPSFELTLERIDNDKNYEPGNCKWATRKEQNNNQRDRKDQKWFYGHGPNEEMIIENNQHRVARLFNLENSNISLCLSNKRKQHKGWTFRLIP